MKKIIAEVLNFRRRIDSSPAIFYGVDWHQRENMTGDILPIREKTVRGVKDHRIKPTAKNPDITTPNPQMVDYCILGMQENTLRIKFNLQMAGRVQPAACSNTKMTERLQTITDYACANNLFYELCRRYVTNIANGRFFWRNRMGAEEIEIKLATDQEQFCFNAFDYHLSNFDQTPDDINKISQIMTEVLMGSRSHFNMYIDACARKIPGIEVYPSQAMVPKKSKKKDFEKNKYLYKVDLKNSTVAGIHSQKITNAIHTIDDWYDSEAPAPIGVNAYGTVTSQGIAYRHPTKGPGKDFFTLFDRAVNKDINALRLEEQYFILAMMVRGAVCSEKDEDKKKKKEEKAKG